MKTKKRCYAILAAAMIAAGCFAQQGERVPAKGFAVFSPHSAFRPYEFTRHAVGDNDVLIDIMYSGICHSDIHTAHNDWYAINYPLVPGHEIAGRVTAVGKNVTKFKVGDYAGVGCMVNSCGHCPDCEEGHEQGCKGTVYTYASTDIYHDNEPAQGGYANNIVVSENFAIKIPANADMKRVAPLLCAGVTTYSPIRFSNVKAGDRVAVAGFGGLGHLAVKYLVKLGADVTVFDVTDSKRQLALNMGAKQYVNIHNADELKGTADQFSFLLSTVPVNYDLTMYLGMLKRGGEMGIVGLPAYNEQPSINVLQLVHLEHKKVYGSLIGGIAQTQEMLDYSVANGIYPDVELIPADAAAIDDAYRNVQDGKAEFRYVIDMSTMK